MKKTSTFRKRNFHEIFHITKPHNCNSEKTVYLLGCEKCGKQCAGSSKTKFCYRANNYKSTYRKFSNKKKVPKEALRQNIFHEHFCSIDYSGTLELVITLIEQFEDK